jgi:biopolymer transport protein ExbD
MSSKRKGMPEAHAEHPNVVPMIDIIMCLIVFYMLAARIGVDTGADDSIEIPESIIGINLEDIGNTLTLNVRGGIGDDPFITAMVPDPDTGRAVRTDLKIIDRTTGRKQLLETLKFLRYGRDRQKGGTGVNADNDLFSIIIYGDAGMDYRFLEPVLLTCAEANVANVNFATKTVEQRRPAS